VPTYRTSFETAADPSAVFTYLSRFDRAEEWDPGVATAEMLTGLPVGLGTRFRLTARFRSMPLEYEIVEFVAPERVVLRAETAFLRSTDTITVGPEGSGTRVHYEAVLEAKSWARIADPFLAIAFRRIGDRAAAGLRTQLASVSR
jgi:carbon monoxide dehydrogenase subunit G